MVSFYDAYGICGDQATIVPPIMKQPSRSEDPAITQSPAMKSHRTFVGGFRKKKNKKKKKNNKKSKNKKSKKKKDEKITGKKLFKLLPNASTEGIAECESMTDIDSCIKIDIDFDILKDESDLSLDDSGVVFKHVYTEHNDDDTTTFSYETDDMDSALFLYTNSSGYHEIDGSFNHDKPKCIIDNCGENCHVLIGLGEKRLNPNPEPELEKPLGKFFQGVHAVRIITSFCLLLKFTSHFLTSEGR